MDTKSYASTKPETDAWMAGEVQPSSSIHRVVLYGDKRGAAMGQIEVYLGTTSSFADESSVVCASVEVTLTSHPYVFDCSSVMEGKTWVIVRQMTGLKLDIGEIFVFDA